MRDHPIAGHDLDEVGHVHGHLLDLSGVELLDITEVPHVTLNRERRDTVREKERFHKPPQEKIRRAIGWKGEGCNERSREIFRGRRVILWLSSAIFRTRDILEHFTSLHLGNEVDGHTLTPKSSRTTYTVDVVLAVCRKIVVDHQRHLARNKTDVVRFNVTGQSVKTSMKLPTNRHIDGRSRR